MMPSACAAPSASAVSSMMRRASSGGRRPRRLSFAPSDSPSTYAITKYTSPSGPSPTEWIGTMCGCEYLDGDAALQPLVASVEDDAHPAPADFSLEGVGAAERLCQAGRECLVCCVHPSSREVRAERLAAPDRACNLQAVIDLGRTRQGDGSTPWVRWLFGSLCLIDRRRVERACSIRRFAMA